MSERKTAKALNFPPQTETRRGMFRRIGSWFMGLGLVSGYGAFAAFIGRFLLSTRPAPKAWQFLTTLAESPVGRTITYVSPAGEKIVIARVDQSGEADDFIALSSVCPHLGCQVHWEPQNDRFFCPCHNGVFNPQGTAIAGPPAEAGQSLARYPLRVENGMLFIEVQTESLVKEG